MQNAGLQYGQGAAGSHQAQQYVHPDASPNGGTTTALRQFRKKDSIEKQSLEENPTHIARVAPHNHFPRTDYYKYQQYPDYLQCKDNNQVKYSEIIDQQQQQQHDHTIQKVKNKEYVDMCNMQQNQMNLNQQYPDPNMHQYLHKDQQVHLAYKESQYYSKENYAQMQMPKCPIPTIRKYPHQNDFLSKLQRCNPSMAKTIISDHSRDVTYNGMDQNRMYAQNQRYYQQGNNYIYNNMQHYYPSCNYKDYPRPAHQPRYPMNLERPVSPRYQEMMYNQVQKVSPNYYLPEYAQHYQHRRAQEFYPQGYRQGYGAGPQIPHEIPENPTLTISDNLKQYIENWADEDPPVDNEKLSKEREVPENVVMINASELQYIQNNIESAIPLVTENGKYILQGDVAIDNNIVRIVDNKEGEVVSLHIVDKEKIDGNEKVVIHSNTVIKASEAVDKVDKNCSPINVIEEKEEVETKEEKEAEAEDTSSSSPGSKDMPFIDLDDEFLKKVDGDKVEEIVEELDFDKDKDFKNTKRSRRIFSVDDIINTIGKSSFEEKERRRSLQITREFLQKEIGFANLSCERKTEDKEEENDKDDKIEAEDKEVKEAEKAVSSSEDLNLEAEDVQYRSAIKVEESSVLLHIAGELVEINVNTVNGKKVITVVPISDTSVVDYNDNYEVSERNSSEIEAEEIKTNENEAICEETAQNDDGKTEESSQATEEISQETEEEKKLESKEELDMEPISETVLESGNEVVIGEAEEDQEEIKLEEAQNPEPKEAESNSTASEQKNEDVKNVVSTKAAKKLYEEPKETKESLQKEDKTKQEEKPKKKKKETVEDQEEEFVSFKELVKARKERKKKLKAKEIKEVKEPVKKKKELKKTQENKIDSTETKNKPILVKTENVENKPVSNETPSLNTEEKVVKKVSFAETETETEAEVESKQSNEETVVSSTTTPEKPLKPKPRINRDPRLRSSEEENQNKKKLSLQEYKKKRKISFSEPKEPKKPKPVEDDEVVIELETEKDFEAEIDASLSRLEEKMKAQRQASLEEVLLVTKSASKQIRSFAYDWEETQSPKVQSQSEDKCLNDFRGLLNNQKKFVIDIEDLKVTPRGSEGSYSLSSEDDKLTQYKDKIESELSSLKFIPKPVKNEQIHPKVLMRRFLNRESLTSQEMEEIKRIISCKRMMEKHAETSDSSLPLSPSYEINKHQEVDNLKLHLKKVPGWRRRKSFRIDESSTETDSEAERQIEGDYSVVQSNSLCGVPKLIIKRKTDPQPVVRLERLDLDLYSKKRKLRDQTQYNY